MNFPSIRTAATSVLALIIGNLTMPAAVPTSAQDCLDYSDYLRLQNSMVFAGNNTDIAVAGDLAYLTAAEEVYNSKLYVLDISDPEAPLVLGTMITAGWPIALAIAQNRAVVSSVTGYSPLETVCEVVDLSDPAQPAVLGAVTIDYNSQDLAIAGSHAYLATGGPELVVIDIADSQAPAFLAAVATPDTCLGVAIHGDLALVSDQNAGLQVIDITEPATPTLIGGVVLPGESWKVAVAGPYAYVANYPNGLQVIDLADPTQPVVVGSAPGALRDLTLSGGLAFAVTSNSLVPYDITDPTAPTRLGNLFTVGWSNGVAVAGSHVLVAAGDLQVADASNPNSAPWLAVMPEPGFGQSVVTADDFVYVSDEALEGGGLWIYDLSDPAVPVKVAFLPLQGCDSLTRDDTLIYADADIGLVIIDVSDPFSPTVLGVWEHDYWHLWDLLAWGGYVYAAALNQGLAVVNVTDPTSPIQVDEVYESGYTARLVHDGTHLFVNRLTDGIWVMSLTDPAHPQIEAVIPRAANAIPYYYGGMSVRDGLLWVGYGEAGVFVIDVSDIHATTVVGSVDTPDYARGVALAGETAYVSDRNGHLQVIDASNPAAPWIVGNLPVGAVTATITDAGHVLVVDVRAGVFVALPQCPGVVPVLLAEFRAAPVVDGVEITWRTGAATGPCEFKLEGMREHAIWDVPYQALGAGWFVASDTAELATNPGEVTYRLQVRDRSGDWRLLATQSVIRFLPTVHPLHLTVQPNPFNPSTTISYEVSVAGPTLLQIFDLRGRLIATLWDEVVTAGRHEVQWDGRDARGREMPSGIYYSRLEANGQVAQGRMTLVR